MDSEIIRHNLYFDKDTVAYIKQYMLNHHLRRFSSAVMSIISEYRRLSEARQEILDDVRENNANLKKVLNKIETEENKSIKESSAK